MFTNSLNHFIKFMENRYLEWHCSLFCRLLLLLLLFNGIGSWWLRFSVFKFVVCVTHFEHSKYGAIETESDLLFWAETKPKLKSKKNIILGIHIYTLIDSVNGIDNVFNRKKPIDGIFCSERQVASSKQRAANESQKKNQIYMHNNTEIRYYQLVHLHFVRYIVACLSQCLQVELSFFNRQVVSNEKRLLLFYTYISSFALLLIFQSFEALNS